GAHLLRLATAERMSYSYVPVRLCSGMRILQLGAAALLVPPLLNHPQASETKAGSTPSSPRSGFGSAALRYSFRAWSRVKTLGSWRLMGRPNRKDAVGQAILAPRGANRLRWLDRH